MYKDVTRNKMTNKKHKFSAKNKDDLQEKNASQDCPAQEENIEGHEQTDELSKLQEENAKLKDAFLRAYAEAENIKKRCQQDIEKNTKYAISSFAKELLGVADNLQRAIDSIAQINTEENESLLQGVKLTQNELTHVFEKFGVKKVDSIGKIFDPNIERVVQEIEDPSKPAGTIVTELQSAYTLNDRILREAMVIVTKGGTK